MRPRPPRSTRTYALFPYTTRVRSHRHHRRTDRRGDRPGIRRDDGADVPRLLRGGADRAGDRRAGRTWTAVPRSEEHTSELQSLMRISYAVFCLKKKIKILFLHATYTDY